MAAQDGSFLGARPLLLYVDSYIYQNHSKGRKTLLRMYLWAECSALINIKITSKMYCNEMEKTTDLWHPLTTWCTL